MANFREFLEKNTIFNEHPVQGVQETNVFFPLYGGEQLILTRDLSVTHIEKRNSLPLAAHLNDQPKAAQYWRERGRKNLKI